VLPKWRKNIKAFTSGKKIRQAPGGFDQNVGVFGIRWRGPQATLFDMAAKGTISQNLTAKYGGPSRIIYRAYDMMKDDVERQVTELVNKVMKLVGKQGQI